MTIKENISFVFTENPSVKILFTTTHKGRTHEFVYEMPVSDIVMTTGPELEAEIEGARLMAETHLARAAFTRPR